MISDITVIILLYKTPEKLLKNFKVLKKFKIILLDQSNDKIVKKKLLKILPKITHYTVRSDNLGFSKGINELIKKVKTKYFFCIQPDVKINAKSIYDLKKTYINQKTRLLKLLRRDHRQVYPSHKPRMNAHTLPY